MVAPPATTPTRLSVSVGVLASEPLAQKTGRRESIPAVSLRLCVGWPSADLPPDANPAAQTNRTQKTKAAPDGSHFAFRQPQWSEWTI